MTTTFNTQAPKSKMKNTFFITDYNTKEKNSQIRVKKRFIVDHNNTENLGK